MNALILLFSSFFNLTWISQVIMEFENKIAIQNVEAWIGTEECADASSGRCIEKIPNAVILIKNGLIESVSESSYVGWQGTNSEGYVVKDGHGLIATIGFFDIGTSIGLPSISGSDIMDLESVHSHGHSHNHTASSVAGIQEERGFDKNNIDDFKPDASHVKLARRGGVALALIRGSGLNGIVCLSDSKKIPGYAEKCSDVQSISLPWDGGSKGKELWKKWKEDADFYMNNSEKFSIGELHTLSLPFEELEVLSKAFNGDIPVFVSVSDAKSILDVIKIAKEWGMKLILQGVHEGWVVAKEIAESQYSVLIDSEANLLGGFDSMGATLKNGQIMAEHGVNVIFSAFSSHNLQRIRFKAGIAWANGLSEGDALAAITENPATALGLNDYSGKIEKGMRADIALWTDHPFEYKGRLNSLMVGGNWVDLKSRQDYLFEKYRELPVYK
tara:strand:+ start:11643 stop:12974 length:1332 start_codon:yes stop_codon:yes gene_type:complete